MKKNLFSVFLVLLTLLTLFAVSADSPDPMLHDGAGVLSEGEESHLRLLQEELSYRYGITAVIVTVPTLNGADAEDYANDYYDSHGFAARAGLLLLVDVGGREYYLLADKDANRDAYLDRIEAAFLPYLRDSDYAGAYEAYLLTADRYAALTENTSAASGFDPSELVVPILVALALALLVAWLVTAAMRRKMKTARPKSTAHDYVRRDSFSLREKTDLYLYCTRTRVRVNNNTSSGGRSGGSRGGRGGSF